MNDVHTDRPLRLESVTHRYGRSTVLRDVSLGVEEGEFVTLLGPSGCGKTTLLRVIAGFLRPTDGRVYVEGRDVTRVPPHKRPVNMVFQRATLFPHLSVADNIGFGLRIAGVSRREIKQRVTDALSLTRLDGFGSRRSYELSGGQVQRVALARAIVNRPKVLLFDEPLSALDLKIRLEMEVELRRVHRETGATSIYVTHDQREALALSDRVAVLDRGRIEQVGTPNEIYRSPGSEFVARFVGNANVIPIEVVRVEADNTVFRIRGLELRASIASQGTEGAAWLVLRPEAVRLTTDEDRASMLRGVVRDVAFRGAGHSYLVEIQGFDDLLKAELSAGLGPPVAIGDAVSVSWDPRQCQILKDNTRTEDQASDDSRVDHAAIE